MDFKVKMWVVSPLPIVLGGMVFVAMDATAFPVENNYSRKQKTSPKPRTLEPHFDPLENQNVQMPSNGKLIEGDVLISSVDVKDSSIRGDLESVSRMSIADSIQPIQPRGPVVASNQQWTSGVVPYALDPRLNETEEQTILWAMLYIMNVTHKCVQFIPRTPNDPDFVFITSSISGCYSEIGRKGRNQTVSVSRASDCVTRGIVMHELLHVLGFWHEHTRPDRDKYIEVLLHNVRVDRKGDFAEKKIEENAHNLQIAYDFYSILHYKTNQFSIRDDLKTIQIRDATVDERMVGQRFNLSSLDVLRIKRLYGCG
ncbi:hatching enzyme 1.2-like isoform X2 [Dreissena polymorpha]|uniref:Metalloendopeptidase n=1 Tax=Dreissena polymorpha TaxID=45954 RepID=A0A9D4M8T0_DREPO|nr:hatching enzyme 1.2-like isoform X2 [Dreissena polymorpha]KAH3871314.1 hypothetical protein DPMN_034511 [Dreissena polymorpha]